MKRALLFGGTTESHEIADFLLKEGWQTVVSVTSQYAADLLKLQEGLTVRVGRMEEAEMALFISDGDFDLIIDATHPYAVEVTANIKRAADKTAVRCLRFLRERSNTDGFVRCSNIEEAAKLLLKTEGSILIATGSKELEKYACYPQLIDRCAVRVLPTVESIEKCQRLGFKRENIIAMQGPFSEQLNAAIFDKYSIKTVVTKDGGTAGGFAEKVTAAQKCGVDMIVVARPDETGLSMCELITEIKAMKI